MKSEERLRRQKERSCERPGVGENGPNLLLDRGSERGITTAYATNPLVSPPEGVVVRIRFNELVTRWDADHVYKHDDGAMLTFWLVCLIAFNLFQPFFRRN